MRGLTARRVWPDHTGYSLSGGWIEPDVSVSWTGQRQDEKYFLGSPMVAVEILSPGEDIERKLTLYFGKGALEVWVIDPRRKTLIVYVRRHDEVVPLSVDREYRSEAAQGNRRSASSVRLIPLVTVTFPRGAGFRASHRKGECEMAVQWEKDVDAGLRRAKESGHAVLLDFSAAPM